MKLRDLFFIKEIFVYFVLSWFCFYFSLIDKQKLINEIWIIDLLVSDNLD